MNSDRVAFASSRPLPPFGVVIKAVVEALQLCDPETYDAAPPEARVIEALRNDGTTLRYAQGDLLRDSTKRAVIEALATALARLPWLPIRSAPVDLTDALCAFADYYEHTSDLLANIALDADLFPRNLARLLAVATAVRAGALDVLDGRHLFRDHAPEQPTWIDEASAKKWVTNLVAGHGFTRDSLADALGASRSTVDRLLGKQPAIPPASYIRRLGQVLDLADSRQSAFSHSTQLRRHFAALHLRRILLPVLKTDPELRSELISTFQRVRRSVRSFAQALCLGTHTLDPGTFLHLFLTGGQHDAHRSFWGFLMQSEPISEWTEVYQVQATGSLVVWNETRHAQLAGFREIEIAHRKGPAAVARLAAGLDVASALRVNPLITEAAILEQRHDLSAALAKLESASLLAPKMASLAHSLGKLYGRMKRWLEAEIALRRALAIGPADAGLVSDLACTLVYAHRAPEAAAMLEQHAFAAEHSGMIAWTWALVELRRGNHEPALRHAQSAVKARFTPGHSHLIAAYAARSLGKTALADEYEKRARELGWIGREDLFPS